MPKSFSQDLNTALKLFEVLREEVDAELPAQMAHSFLCIALRPGLTMQNLCEMTGLSQSSASRNVQTLGKWHRIGKPGYDLVEAVEDPNDTRRKIMFLTNKGRELAAKVVGTVRGAAVTLDEVPNLTAKAHVSAIYKSRAVRA